MCLCVYDIGIHISSFKMNPSLTLCPKQLMLTKGDGIVYCMLEAAELRQWRVFAVVLYLIGNALYICLVCTHTLTDMCYHLYSKIEWDDSKSILSV